jgi:PrtD family type I secretion system ABC transporter
MFRGQHDGTTTPLTRVFAGLAPGFAGVGILSLFINLSFLVTPLYMIQISDRVMLSKSLVTLGFITAIAALFIIVLAVLDVLRNRALMRLSAAFDAELGPEFYKRMSRAAVVASRTSLLTDFNTVRDAIASPLLKSVFNVVFTPLFIVAAFMLHPVFGWLCIFGVVLIAGLSVLNQIVVTRPTRQAREAATREFELSNAIGRNADAVQAMGMTPGLTRLWSQVRVEAARTQRFAQDRAGIILGCIALLRQSEFIVVYAVGALLYIEREIGAGVLMAAAFIGLRAIGPIEQVVAGWRTIVSTRDAHQRLSALFAASAHDTRMDLPPPVGKLKLARVTASAPGAQLPIVKDVSFELNPGRVLGVVGSSGAGKSSLMRIVVGAWTPQRGTVSLDGHALAHWDPDKLGRHIGFVPQDVELITGTIAQNIARFDEPGEETARAVMAAARDAGVTELIASLPQGFNTKVGSGGQILSGGQRQRIALARALYGDPVLVVLDEPNSNLDAQGEEALGRAIEGLRERGKTVVLVTHKLNLLVYCDDVLVMHSGTAHAFGSRDEIMKRLPAQRLTALRAVS